MNMEAVVVDEACLGALFARYAPSLKRMLSRRPVSAGAGFRSARADKDLDDLLQDTFLSVLACSRRVPSLRVTPAYLFTVARNLRIDRWRRRGERFRAELGDFNEATSVRLDEFEPERDQRERVETLARYTEHLPPQLARIYEARFVRGLSQRDAAAVLSISRGQLRTLERCLFSGAIQELSRASEPSGRHVAAAGSSNWHSCRGLRRSVAVQQNFDRP